MTVLAATSSAAPAKSELPLRAAVFVVGADRDSAATAEALETKLTKALEAEQVDLTDLDSLFDAPAVDDTGRKLLAEAKQAFDDLDYVVGVEKAQAALEAFTKHPEGADAKSLAEVHLFIGALSMQLKGKSAAKAAQESFARAILFNPDLTLDEQAWGKEAAKAFDKAKQDVSARGMWPLTVSSSPAGAEVTLRDRPIGLTPLSDAPAVPTGRHLVKLSRPGYAPTGTFADVTDDGANVNATLAPLQGYGEARQVAQGLVNSGVGSGKVPGTAKRLGEQVQARFLVVSAVRGDQRPLEVWDVETGNRLSDVSLTDDASLAAAATRVKDFVAHPSPLAAPVVAVAEQGAGGPVYKKWWFWTAVGVVVVGGATAAGVAAASSKPGYNVVLGTP